jgi:hypothetical protein
MSAPSSPVISPGWVAIGSPSPTLHGVLNKLTIFDRASDRQPTLRLAQKGGMDKRWDVRSVTSGKEEPKAENPPSLNWPGKIVVEASYATAGWVPCKIATFLPVDEGHAGESTAGGFW